MRREELERRLDQGQQVFARGCTARELFVICSGRIRLLGADGAPNRLRGPGEIFGELPAILGTPSPYAAEALEPSLLLALPLALVNRLLRECPEFSARLITHLAREAAGEVVGGAAPEAPRPVATPRGELESWIGQLVPVLLRRHVPGEVPAAVPGSLRDLANDAGLPLRPAYEALHYLLDRGFLQLVDDQLSVLEPDLLQHFRSG
jgi:hypothetical protein